MQPLDHQTDDQVAGRDIMGVVGLVPHASQSPGFFVSLRLAFPSNSCEPHALFMWRQIMTWRQWISALSIAMLASALPLPPSPCAHAQTVSEPPRFTFQIYSNTPEKELLPVAP